MKKIGVIIGRFQCKHLHEGHINLYNSVLERSDEVIVLVGSAVPKLTNRNPLDYKSRELMLKSSLPNVHVAGIRDFNHNERWSENVDKVIQQILVDHVTNNEPDGAHIFEITLYGSRDSFIPHYSGQFPTVELLMCEVEGVSASVIRAEISKTPLASEDFRAGVIYAVGNKYPTTYPTVDIAIYNHNHQVLLGRKEFESAYRFIGGFVDPTDLTLEAAALRECLEEVGENVKLDDFRYVSSRKVNDWRYRGTSDGIMTTFFICKYRGGEVVASDDIVEVKWVSLSGLDETNLVGEHLPLLADLKAYLAK